VGYLEAVGLKVISLTGDKGSYNPKFLKMHRKVAGKSLPSSDVVYKAQNPYSSDKKETYILSPISSKLCTMLGQTHLASTKFEHCG